MPVPDPHPDEIVASLKKSDLPTIVVEGRLDSYVYKYLERQTGASVLPVGGRNSLLQVLKRRSEFLRLPCAFVADRDMWLFTGVPAEAAGGDLVLTDGYSIENDIYRDSELWKLLTPNQSSIFDKECREVCRWFSYAAAQWCNGQAPQLDHHPRRMVGGGALTAPFIATTGFVTECPTRFPPIVADPLKYLRGKTLVDLLLKVLVENGGPTHHRASSLMEVGSIRPGRLLTSLSESVAVILGR